MGLKYKDFFQSYLTLNWCEAPPDLSFNFFTRFQLNQFASLFFKLEQDICKEEKQLAISNFFRDANNIDRIWALALLSNKLRKRIVKPDILLAWACSVSEIPLWLFEESKKVVGDLIETISKIVGERESLRVETTLSGWISFLGDVQKMAKDEKITSILNFWIGLSADERLVFNKIVTGSFKADVSPKMLASALGLAFSLDPILVTYRLSKEWSPSNTQFEDLLLSNGANDALIRPYPFLLAHQLSSPFILGKPAEWQAEWRTEGIRCQLIKRMDQVFLWTEVEELITNQFPELIASASKIPDYSVLDGCLFLWKEGTYISHQFQQPQLLNKSKKSAKAKPAVFVVHDVIEFEGQDYRKEAFATRRRQLELLIAKLDDSRFKVSEVIPFSSWAEIEYRHSESGKFFSEGMMFKRLDAQYGEDLCHQDFWIWKNDLLRFVGVLLYARKPKEGKAEKFSEFTIAVWQGENLIPIAKVNSGLSVDQLEIVNAFIKENTLQKFGPVRSVKPQLVFEIGFESMEPSSRHKSGLILHHAQILSLRMNSTLSDVHSLQYLKGLM